MLRKDARAPAWLQGGSPVNPRAVTRIGDPGETGENQSDVGPLKSTRPPVKGVRVVIVDDHAGFRASARRLLEGQGYDVVGEAADGAEALRVADRAQPDLILVDIHLPDADGRYVGRRISSGRDAPAVILISSRDVDDLGDSIERAGARGFISKAELSGESLAALLQ